jgi:predicted membrane channel-forming protein YqfA (hemolysin III family)
MIDDDDLDPGGKKPVLFLIILLLLLFFVVVLAEVARVLPSEAMNLMFLGGVAYTAGVPFFVRNNST